MGRSAGLVALALTACRVLDEDHCANLAGDATCRGRADGLDHCDRCLAANDGCVAEPPSDPQCSATDTSTDDGAGPMDATSMPLDDDDDSESGESTSASTAPASTSDASTTDTGSSTATASESEASGTTDHLPVCGDGIVEGDEACDGEPPEGLDCAGMPEYAGGTLACDRECMLDASACTPCLGATTPCGDDAECCGESCSGLGVCL